METFLCHQSCEYISEKKILSTFEGESFGIFRMEDPLRNFPSVEVLIVKLKTSSD